MRLTKRAIEALEATGKRYAAFDDDLKGFAVRVGISGDKSFYLVYRAGPKWQWAKTPPSR